MSVVVDSIILEGRFFWEEVIGNDTGNQIGQEVGCGTVSGVLDLADVLQFTVSMTDLFRKRILSSMVISEFFMFFRMLVISWMPSTKSTSWSFWPM